MTGPAATYVPTRALGRAVLICGALVLTGVLLGRVDLVVLAAPFAIGTAWSLRRRPARPPHVAFEVTDVEVDEDATVRMALDVSNEDTVPLNFAVGRLTTSAWLALPGGPRPYAGDLPPGAANRVELRATATHWGQPEIGPAVAYGIAGDGLLISAMVTADASRIRVNPVVAPFRADETMPRLTAMVGVHAAKRPGEGGAFAGIRRYGPGDRPRRIDWRVTLRTGELHVAHTFSDRDAEVVILLDVLYDAGNAAASVLDTTVRAAAAIAEHYLRQGDRVGLVEYSGRPRHLSVAGGRRHLYAVLDWLLSTRASLGAGSVPVFGIDPVLIPNSALVVVLTPLLAPQSSALIATLARAGRTVVAVDSLGAIADRPLIGSQWTEVARRMWRLERENVVGQLREAGVPVTPWVGAGSLDQVLLDMTRMASAPRLGRR